MVHFVSPGRRCPPCATSRKLHGHSLLIITHSLWCACEWPCQQYGNLSRLILRLVCALQAQKRLMDTEIGWYSTWKGIDMASLYVSVFFFFLFIPRRCKWRQWLLHPLTRTRVRGTRKGKPKNEIWNNICWPYLGWTIIRPSIAPFSERFDQLAVVARQVAVGAVKPSQSLLFSWSGVFDFDTALKKEREEKQYYIDRPRRGRWLSHSFEAFCWLSYIFIHGTQTTSVECGLLTAETELRTICLSVHLNRINFTHHTNTTIGFACTTWTNEHTLCCIVFCSRRHRVK